MVEPRVVGSKLGIFHIWMGDSPGQECIRLSAHPQLQKAVSISGGTSSGTPGDGPGRPNREEVLKMRPP